jgi:lactoylglutathione lyase
MKSRLLAGAIAAAATMAALPGAARAQVPFTANHYMMGLSVNDLEGMTNWYVSNLGFKVSQDVPMGTTGRVRFLELGNERIELIKVANSVPGPKRAMPPAHGAQHGWVQLTLEVPDLDVAKNWLVSRGIKPGLDITPIAALKIRIMFIADPEGNLVELVQRMPN